MGIKNAIYRGRVRTVEDAVEAWKRNHEEAENVKDIEAIIAEWLRAEDILIAWQKESWDLLRSGKLRNVLELGDVLERAYRFRTDLLRLVDEGVTWAESRGYHVDNVPEFRQTADKISVLKDEFARKWPRVNKQAIEEGLACLARGDTTELSGWISELHGMPQGAGGALR